jgi:hypothetical protein
MDRRSAGTSILAWINYQAKEPVEGVASVTVRDIARILTPDHVPFVYKESLEPSNPDRYQNPANSNCRSQQMVAAPAHALLRFNALTIQRFNDSTLHVARA